MYFQFYDTLLSDYYLSDIGARYFTETSAEVQNGFEETDEYYFFLIEIFTEETSKIYKRIESDILKAESKERQESLILFIINSVDEYYEKLGEDKNFDLIFEEFEVDLKRLKSKLFRRFGYLLPTKYHKNSSNSPLPKIKWLGSAKLLTTLIFELWQGQDKMEGPKKIASSKPLIQADKQDLAELINNNFLDSKGNRFNGDTISEYLNTSEEKDDCRVPEGKRIEIPKK